MAKAPKRDKTWAIDAITQHFSDLGESVTRAEVLAKKSLLWGPRRTPLFLVEYTLQSGVRSVGFVGPFVKVLDLSVEELNAIPAKTRNRRLFNLYVGQFYLEQARQDPRSIDHPWDKAELEAAFGRQEESVQVLRRAMTQGAENMKDIVSGSLPVQFCSLVCHADPDVVWCEGQYHMVAPVTLTFDLSRGGASANYTGEAVSTHPYYFRSNGEERTLARYFPATALRLSFPRHALAHILGTFYGPCEVRSRWKSVNLKDL